MNNSTRKVNAHIASTPPQIICEVTEQELYIIEQGYPDALYLNIAIALLSVALSFLSVILVTDIPNELTKGFFIALTGGGFFGGAVLIFVYRQNRKNVKPIFNIIRERIEKLKAEQEVSNLQEQQEQQEQLIEQDV